MSRGIEAIPGGATERAANRGGRELRDQLDTLLGGQSMEVVMFALIDVMGRFLISCSDTEAEAEALADVIGGDLKNFARLNHAEGRRQIAELAGRMHRLDGRRQ